MSFINELEKNIENISITENGAVGFKTTNKTLLDMNFKISSYRNKPVDEIVDDFLCAYEENRINAVLWLFYVRDVREGMGERRLFRICFNSLCSKDTKTAIKLLPLIPEYGRWDDLWLSTLDTPVEQFAFKLIEHQLFADLADSKNENEYLPISLLAKWLPSERTSSKNSRELARRIATGINLPINKYNRILSELRKHLNIVERKMSANEWQNIDYSTVPSKSNLIYNSCFFKHDEERRKEYLNSLKNGRTKINAGTLYPYEIVHKYNSVYDETLEQLWKNLKDIGELKNVLTVADGSGSMLSRINNSTATAWDVAHSLAIYSSEHLSGEFKDKYVTFSSHPQFVDLSEVDTLKGKIQIAKRHSEVANTNIKAVFDMVLNTAIQNNMKQSDIPETVLILSDMEFDGCVSIEYDHYFVERPNQKFFDTIKAEYENAGYKLPHLVFWNIMSRTNTIPIKENDLGVALVSGFSPNTFKMVTSGKLDPYKCLLEQLYTDRYKPVLDSIKQ